MKGKCYKCGLEGHLFRQCTKQRARIFCFNCGEDNENTEASETFSSQSKKRACSRLRTPRPVSRRDKTKPKITTFVNKSIGIPKKIQKLASMIVNLEDDNRPYQS